MSTPRVGDDSHEHLRMTRGDHRATLYVVLAVLVQIASLLVPILWVLQRAPLLQEFELPRFIAALAMAIAATTVVYWNRGRVVEAFASRFTTGVVNFSIVTATAAAFVYANVRFLAWLCRVEHRLSVPAPTRHLPVRNAARVRP